MKIDKNPIKINRIFDKISPYYDDLNNFISFYLHKIIKKIAIKDLQIRQNSIVLDACCGTGDFSGIITEFQPKSNVIGLDFSSNMIKLAKQKNPKNVFIIGDLTELPFKDGEFDYVTVGFGLRNIENRKRAIEETFRVLKPNGKFLHLDFGKHNLVSKLFDIFVPFLVKILKKDSESYQYLISSKNDYPEPDEILKEFESCGFKTILVKYFLFGAISYQILKK